MKQPHSLSVFSMLKLSSTTILLLSVTSALTGCQKPTDNAPEEVEKISSNNKSTDKSSHASVPSTDISRENLSNNRVDQIEKLSGVSHSKLIEFDPMEVKQGGQTGVKISSRESYSKPSANIKSSRKGSFFIGNAFFKQPWVASPASTTSRDGLGPLFNVAACQSCHIKDGRGHAPVDSEDSANSLLIRLSIPATTEEEKQKLANSEMAKVENPVYGGQFQDHGLEGVPTEGHVSVVWTDVPITFTDGHVMTIRRPKFTLTNLGYGKLSDDTMMSPRVALPMIGLGLLEHIKAEDIMSQADPDDKDKNNISGKYNWVKSSIDGTLQLGRFGWKAGQPFLLTQNQDAFNGDMGLTSRLNPSQGCTASQKACLGAPSGGDMAVNKEGEPEHLVEVTDEIAKFVEFYTRNLAVPNRRNANEPTVLAGKKHFHEMGCVNCHTPRYKLPTTDSDHLEQHGQIIYPYTDLLLHDMGDDLADRNVGGNIPSKDIQVEFLANSHEWRTPALWGIGLARTVDKQAGFLHDGRARSPMEAVLWHGGEAEDAKNKVLELDEQGRKELDAFLNSL